MSRSYYIDLGEISLAQFQERLETEELMPGRRILQEQIEERFAILAGMGMGNLQDIQGALKTKKRLSQFAQESGLSPDYLTILRREVNSYQPNPVKLAAFPDVDQDCVAQLTGIGIKNSRHLFDQSQTADQRTALIQQTGAAPDDLVELIAFSDLVRISGVGPVFARILYDAGVKSTASLADEEAASLYQKLVLHYQAIGYTRVDFSEKDMLTCIEMAGKLS